MMFNIKTASDFYTMVVDDYDEYVADPTSARKALHCALSAYHLHEWVWGDWVKKDKALKQKLNIKTRRDFLRFLDTYCPWFSTIQALTVGTKHFGSQQGIETTLIQGFSMGSFSKATYSKGYLLIDHGGEDDVHRFKTAMELLEFVVRFWRDFFKAYHVDQDLPESDHHFKPL